MYDAHQDPYCYPGTSVLRNKLDLRTEDELEAFAALITHQRADEPLPIGALDFAHYRAIHHHLFQDVFDWAGEIRTVRLAKAGNMFCYPENIHWEMQRAFDSLAESDWLHGRDHEDFAAAAAHLLAEVNAIHPFREGNGRTQNSFLKILAEAAGHPLDFARLDPAAMLAGMVASFHGNERPLRDVILQIRRSRK